jgi:hypothetical protein
MMADKVKPFFSFCFDPQRGGGGAVCKDMSLVMTISMHKHTQLCIPNRFSEGTDTVYNRAVMGSNMQRY